MAQNLDRMGKNQKLYIQIQIPCVISIRTILVLLWANHKSLPSMVLRKFYGEDFIFWDRNLIHMEPCPGFGLILPSNEYTWSKLSFWYYIHSLLSKIKKIVIYQVTNKIYKGNSTFLPPFFGFIYYLRLYVVLC